MLWRSFGYVMVIGALAAGTTTIACGGSEPNPPSSSTGDPLALPASGETQSAIGVQTWGFRMTGADTLSVRGYDGENRSVVEVRQRVTTTDPYHWALDLGVALGSSANAVSTLHFALESRTVSAGTEVSGTLTNDTLSANATARKVLDRLRADVRSPSNASSSSGSRGTGLTTNALRPLDLVGQDPGGVTSGDDDRLTGDGDGGLSGGDAALTSGDNGSNGSNDNGSNDNGQQCQSNGQCGGDMMSSLEPVLDMMSSAGQGLSSFLALYECMNTDAGTPSGPVVLPQIVTCALKQFQSSENSSGDGGSAQSSQLSSLLDAFRSMQSSGQNCNCPQ